jgi:hypothetical protein
MFWVKKLKFFHADPGWKKFGFGLNIPDPQHWIFWIRLFEYEYGSLLCEKALAVNRKINLVTSAPCSNRFFPYMATDKNSNVFYSCEVPYAALHFKIFK